MKARVGAKAEEKGLHQSNEGLVWSQGRRERSSSSEWRPVSEPRQKRKVFIKRMKAWARARTEARGLHQANEGPCRSQGRRERSSSSE